MTKQPDCQICRKHDDGSLASRIVYSDDHWLVVHSHETNILGYFFIEAKRHMVDLSQATRVEAEGYGVLLKRLMATLRKVLECERVYSISLGEAVPHCHFHVIPRCSDLPRGFRGRHIMSYPTSPPANSCLVDEVCARVRQALLRDKAEKC